MTPKQKYRYRRAKKGQDTCDTCVYKAVQLLGRFKLLGAKCDALASEENASKAYHPGSYVDDKTCGVKTGMVCIHYTLRPSLKAAQ